MAKNPKKPRAKANVPRALTNNIYGTKKSGRWGRLNAEERAVWRIEHGVFATDDLSQLPSNVVDDFRKLVNSRKKEIAQQMADNPTYRSVKDAPKSLTIRTKSNNPETLFREYARQQSFQRDFESDIEYEFLKEFNQVNYPELDKVLEDDDKWTILRRLAQVDPMLNIDRAYASQVLHDIERMIETETNGGEYDIDKRSAIDRITSHYISPAKSVVGGIVMGEEGYYDEKGMATSGMFADWETASEVAHTVAKAKTELDKIKRMTDSWNEELQALIPAQDFYSTALQGNKGFHGVKKAVEKMEREEGEK